MSSLELSVALSQVLLVERTGGRCVRVLWTPNKPRKISKAQEIRGVLKVGPPGARQRGGGDPLHLVAGTQASHRRPRAPVAHPPPTLPPSAHRPRQTAFFPFAFPVEALKHASWDVASYYRRHERTPGVRSCTMETGNGEVRGEQRACEAGTACVRESSRWSMFELSLWRPSLDLAPRRRPTPWLLPFRAP